MDRLDIFAFSVYLVCCNSYVPCGSFLSYFEDVKIKTQEFLKKNSVLPPFCH